MTRSRGGYLGIGVVISLLWAPAATASDVIRVDTPMTPPEWALLERSLLDVQESACEEFFGRYFDERGFLLCVERWGGDDGPDDAMECCNDWPLLHSLGASDRILTLYKKAWEGHLRQYTLARTTEVPFARDGMYYKEFSVMFDWLHHGEGLTPFNLQGLSDPEDVAFQKRVRRYAGLYMNDDPQAPNYDPKHKIIRSLFTGSRGPLLRRATGLDWAGDPIEVEGRFTLLHHERSYEEMLAHFKDYNDVIGDHPSNLSATTLALNAFLLSGEERYRRWLLEYVDAWAKRTKDNGGIIPSNIGLDGKIGGATDGKWYGGVYGWSFSVVVPQDGSIAHRNTVGLGVLGFVNAHFLTGDTRYLDVWGDMIDRVNSSARIIDGVVHYPRMYGDDGWYAYTPSKYNEGALELWYASLRPRDRARLPGGGWIGFLEGKNPAYPVERLRADLERVRIRVESSRRDKSTPDTRLADNPMEYNPASVASLVELMLGGYHPGARGHILNARLRYFDPVARRAGVPDGVGALVTRFTDRDVEVILVNVNQVAARSVVVQTGAYREHLCESVTLGGRSIDVGGGPFEVRLAPGCGAKLVVRSRRYTGRPTMAFPWN